MDKEVLDFSNEQFGTIRTIEKDGQVWFIGNDVAEALGYSNIRKAVPDHVDEEDKLRTQIRYAGQTREVTVINESGLYSLILSSKLPTAKQFKRWVTSEVLPTIRKHGGYLTPEKAAEVLLNPDTIIELAKQIKGLKAENAMQAQQIAELKPKKDYVDIILSSPDTVTTAQIAADYGMSARKLNQLLHERGFQYKVNGQWLLYQKYRNKGYTKSETIDVRRADGTVKTVMHTKWTQKGRLMIHGQMSWLGYPAQCDTLTK